MYSVASGDVETRGGVDNVGTIGRAESHVSWNFLLACAASPFTSEHLRLIRGLAESELDWHALLNLAEVHGLLPTVHERLNEISSAVPDEIRRVANHAFEQNARQTLWLTQLLFEVSDLFQRQGIEALPYKGPVLSQLLYGSVAARQYSDIDILVRAADVPRARLLLHEAGFNTHLQLNARDERAYIASGYEYTFQGMKNPNVLELQWRILPGFWAVDFDTADFFARSQCVEIGQKSISTLGNEDLMLVLCTHAAKHTWSKLSWIRDVAELSQSRNLDWDQVIHEAARFGIQRIFGVTFRLATELFSTHLPPGVQRLIAADNAVHGISEETCRNLETGAEPEVESLAYFRFIASLRERRVDRVRFWWRLAVTPGVSEWSFVRLPGLMFPFYRGVRFARLVKRLMGHS